VRNPLLPVLSSLLATTLVGAVLVAPVSASSGASAASAASAASLGPAVPARCSIIGTLRSLVSDNRAQVPGRGELLAMPR
jgi:hypothetical protein